MDIIVYIGWKKFCRLKKDHFYVCPVTKSQGSEHCQLCAITLSLLPTPAFFGKLFSRIDKYIFVPTMLL